jgi:hypothetical protein
MRTNLNNYPTRIVHGFKKMKNQQSEIEYFICMKEWDIHLKMSCVSQSMVKVLPRSMQQSQQNRLGKYSLVAREPCSACVIGKLNHDIGRCVLLEHLDFRHVCRNSIVVLYLRLYSTNASNDKHKNP